MKFSIITPTYKRADILHRAIQSLLQQTYTDWEMIIINDSPQEETYSELEKNISDKRIVYLKNTENKGVNFSRNRGLDAISPQSKWVIFLDDDDYLTPDALEALHQLIQSHPDKKWLITNRAYAQGNSLTHFPASDTTYSYAWDYLLLKRGRGDATHCIQTELINQTRFSKQIAQGEEWFFFYQIGLQEKIFYHSHNTTLTDGYNTAGLNFRKRSKKAELKTLQTLITTGSQQHLLHHPTFLLYLCLRFIRLIYR